MSQVDGTIKEHRFCQANIPLLVWTVDSEYFTHTKNVANGLLLIEVLSAGEVDIVFGPVSDQKFVFRTWKIR